MNLGWGDQPWGTSPWGGTTVEQVIGGFGPRFEKVRREYRRFESPSIRNVLFAVDGVAAKLRLGSPHIIAGHGTFVSLRPHWSQCSLGVVEIQAGTGTWAAIHGIASVCKVGQAEGAVSMEHEILEGLAGEASVGAVRIHSIRNPTDEEFLMMVARVI